MRQLSDATRKYQSAWVKRRLSDLKVYFGVCQNPECAIQEGLEFAHIEPTPILRTEAERRREGKRRGRGRNNRLWDILRHPDKYTFFCNINNCHRRYDNGELKVKPKSLQELAEEKVAVSFASFLRKMST